MTTRIGLAIGSDAVRAVAVRRGRITWGAELPLASLEELQATITTLLAGATVPRWPKPVVHAAVGPCGVQVKRVMGLPEVADADALGAIIREAAGTYFLKNGVPLLMTSVLPTGPGIAIAAALERPYVEAIRGACRSRGWRLGPIAPAAVALTRALTGVAFHWNDGPLTIEVSRDAAGVVDGIRTRPARPDDAIARDLVPVPALAAFGSDAIRFADAFGAVGIGPREPLTIASGGAALRTIALPRRTLTIAIAISVTGAVAVGLSPLAAAWAGRRAIAHVHGLRPGRWQVITRSLGQLDKVTAILRQAQAFSGSRTTVSTLLGELARLLPQQSAVIEFEWEDAEGRGEVTVVTPDPTAVLAAVRRLPGIGAVELAGSVSRQSVAGQDLQRVVIQFTRTARR
jgi:hypothetical protein